MVRHISDRVAVMYLGKIVEIGDESQIYDHPTHPYTQALLSAVPVPDPTLRGHRDQIVLTGRRAVAGQPAVSGCRFRTRCWKAQEICADRGAAADRPGPGRRTRARATSPRYATWFTPPPIRTSLHPSRIPVIMISGHDHGDSCVDALREVPAQPGREWALPGIVP